MSSPSSGLPSNLPGSSSNRSSSSGSSVKTSTTDNHLFEVILIAILIILVVLLLLSTFYYLRRREECFTYPSIWCYRDWTCPNVPAGQPNNRWDMLKAQALAILPATEGKCFIQNGKVPAGCPNAWQELNIGSTTCTGPNGATAPCDKAYNSQTLIPLPSSTT